MSESDAGTSAAPGQAPVGWHVANSGVMTITLQDPDTRNVLNHTSLPMLVEAFERAAEDARVRVVVLTGTGNTFCAGADLRGARSEGAVFDDRAPAALAHLLTLMLELAKPIVGRVQGHVAGGGNGLVAACDIAVAVESAKFAFSEVRVGVAPAVISTVCLRKMPPAIAAELFLAGERVSAERAREAGLVARVVAEGDLDVAVAGYVAALQLGGPHALARTKELLLRVPALSLAEGFAWTADLSADLFASPEAAEGMTAFLERRPPSWAPQ